MQLAIGVCKNKTMTAESDTYDTINAHFSVNFFDLLVWKMN